MARSIKLILIPVVTLLITSSIKGQEEPTVEFEEIWGTVIVPAGKLGSTKEEFTCIARNVDKNGKFVWTIDGNQKENENSVQDSSSDGEIKLEQTFVMDAKQLSDPITELNNKKLRCSYIQENGAPIVSPEVRISVAIQDLPQEKVSVTGLKVGSPGNISITMEVFPEPRKDHYEWIIEDKSTNTKVEVKPGNPNNADAGYSAEINHLGGIKYESVLQIKNVSMDLEQKTISMIAQDNKGGNQDTEDSSNKVEFELSLSNEPEVNTMNIGIWIILAVIVVIIIICIVYCIYNGNCCKKKDNKGEDTKKEDYQAVPQKPITDV